MYSERVAEPFDWSPDGGSILALRKVSGEANNQLVLISTSDGSVRVLRDIAAAWYMLTKARFSPDGRFIAFSLVGEGHPAHADVYVMSADGRNEAVVAGHPAEDELLDGRRTEAACSSAVTARGRGTSGPSASPAGSSRESRSS